MDIEEQKLPPLGDDLVRQSAKSVVGMFSSEWQVAQFSDSDEERQQAPKFHWDGQFTANPQAIGAWKLVGQTDTIETFDPAAKPVAPRQPVANSLQLADKGETGHPLLIWSDDRMMDLTRYQALKMKRIKLLVSNHLLMAAITSLLLTGAHAKTWTSADGAKTFEGELLSYDPRQRRGGSEVVQRQGDEVFEEGPLRGRPHFPR